MESPFTHVEWGGEQYVLVRGLTDGPQSGAIATREQYKSGAVSTAHLFENGEIWCYGQCVGYISELTFGESFDDLPFDDDAPDTLFDQFLSTLVRDWRF